MTTEQTQFAQDGLTETLTTAIQEGNLIRTPHARAWAEFFEANLVNIPGSPFTIEDIKDDETYAALVEMAEQIESEVEDEN